MDLSPQKKLSIQGVEVLFPCKPYGSQISIMDRIIKGLNNKQNCLIESPTGSGKSLALICSSLSWQRKQRQILETETAQRDKELELLQYQACDFLEGMYQPKPVENIVDTSTTEIPTVTLSPPEGEAQENSNVSKPNLAKRPIDVIHLDSDDDDFQPMKKAKKFRQSILEVTLEPEVDSHNETTIVQTPENLNQSLAGMPPPPSRKLPQIFFCTRTHKQIGQIVRELKKTEYRDVKMCILSSRERTCIHPEVSRSFTKNDDCKQLLDAKKSKEKYEENVGCRYFDKVHKINHDSIKYDFGFKEAWDLEDFVKLSRRHRFCPYFSLRGLMQDADIVFCPYNYLIDPLIRASMDISLNQKVIIFDEAHNIEDSARDAASLSLKQDELTDALVIIETLINRNIISASFQTVANLLSDLCQLMHKFAVDLPDYKGFDQAGKVWSGEELVAILSTIKCGPNNFNDLKLAITHLSEEKNDNNEYLLSGKVSNILRNLELKLDYLYKNDLENISDFRGVILKTASTVEVKDDGSGWLSKSNKTKRYAKNWTYSLNLWCLNPGVAFNDFSKVHSLIVASGTLSPMASFQSELNTPFKISLEANHIISDAQIWVGTIGVGPNNQTLNGTFKFAETFSFQDELGQVVLNVCQKVPKGVLCFLSSYSMLDKLASRWQSTGVWEQIQAIKVIVCEPRGSAKVNFDVLLKEFYQAIEEEEGALMLAVCRGKVSEGLDFADNNARAVITVGIPFPNFKDIQVDLKKKYNNQHCASRQLMSGNDWYETQAFRALNQALGRCLRHKNDWGALILIDERFQKNNRYINSLSKWVRKNMRHYSNFKGAMDSLSGFVEGRLVAAAESENVTLTKETTATPETTYCMPPPKPLNLMSMLPTANLVHIQRNSKETLATFDRDNSEEACSGYQSTSKEPLLTMPSLEQNQQKTFNFKRPLKEETKTNIKLNDLSNREASEKQKPVLNDINYNILKESEYDALFSESFFNDGESPHSPLLFDD